MSGVLAEESSGAGGTGHEFGPPAVSPRRFPFQWPRRPKNGLAWGRARGSGILRRKTWTQAGRESSGRIPRCRSKMARKRPGRQRLLTDCCHSMLRSRMCTVQAKNAGAGRTRPAVKPTGPARPAQAERWQRSSSPKRSATRSKRESPRPESSCTTATAAASTPATPTRNSSKASTSNAR